MDLSVIVPIRAGGDPVMTLDSLRDQQVSMEIILVWDRWDNANKARNHGWGLARAPFLLFCDDDIRWKPGALRHMLQTLKDRPEAYVYGAYCLGDKYIQCNRNWDEKYLFRENYISTMSIIRSECFPGFDPELKRLQDWDLWLTMLQQGHTGVYCDMLVFDTAIRDGITNGGIASYREARARLQEKHTALCV